MINPEESTATIAVSRPAKSKGKSTLEKLQAKLDKLQGQNKSLVDLNYEVQEQLGDALDHIRQLEGQKSTAERKAVSDSHDTRRVANAVLTIDLLMDMAGDNKEMKANLERVAKQLKNKFEVPSEQIEHKT